VFLVLGLGVLAALAILVPLMPFGASGGQQAETASGNGGASGQTGTQSQGTTSAAPPATAPSRARPTTRSASKPLTVKLPQSGLLRRGDAGAAVVTLQKALSAVGFDAGSPDGDFGATTEAAVVGFQKANGLVPDGVLGEHTAGKLNTALAAQ
jgi:peptidoglycan hydrolase-like protein with peptidoglycan-binding domain